MRSIAENSVRRLITASATAVMVHAAVFGVVEWGLSRAANEISPSAQEFSVQVRLTEPEPQNSGDSEPSPSVEEPAPAEPAPVEAAPEEAVSPESEHRQNEVDLAPEQNDSAVVQTEHDANPVAPARSRSQVAVPRQQVADVREIDFELPSPANIQHQIPAALHPPVERRTAAQREQLNRTITPERYTAPRYPEAARRRGVSGTVVVRAAIDRRGRVTEVDMIESSGADSLDSAAVRAVRSWRFARGDQDRHSIHRIRFDLEGSP